VIDTATTGCLIGTMTVAPANGVINQMLADGYSEGRITWRRIKRAIEALRAAPSGPVH
jgi:hypothetical protein